MSAKGKARDKSRSKLGNRMITTMLKNEKLAEKELEKKMKALKDLERKSMVKICETSLDVKYDFRRKRNTQEIEEKLSEDPLNLSLGQGRLLLSPCGSRRGSLIPPETRQEESKETEYIESSGDSGESYNNDGTNPAILISSESQQAGTDLHSERSGSPVVDGPETSSPCASPVGSPPSEDPAISEAESQKLLKVFAQSERGGQRRRTAPEITDLSPKLLIQLAKSSAEIKRRGSTHDASAAADGEEERNETLSASLNSRRRGSAAIELLQLKGEQGKTEGCPTSPSLRRRGSSAVSTSPSNSPILQRRRGSSANAKISLSLETNEALLRDKISGQAPMSPRLKQPLSPLLGRRGSGMAATLRPLSAQSQNKDSASEPMLPDLKRPQSPSLRRSLSPLRANRPVSPARSLSSLSVESTSGQSQLEAIGVPGEYDLMLRRGSRPGLPTNLAVRRGSELSQVELNTLAPNSPLRKAMQDPQATLNPVPASPNAYRRHSGTVEALQDRVNDFLKTLAAK